ncbi:nicotinate (nicotinamide) nucleotide adenylyltransferase [Ignavibacteria bacterium]|jgi:nicotinate-nucleotide adenylyltransferase|nr:nicotinate (nicotinamide) nucleotide adenylyltransferase [Bacteroidota bacterium]MCZ2133214.1 nicotinate (nicotinamide) nucleotide adenylyltransferase [Bacteroidota bacterium]
MNIGIVGGSFDPVHTAHLILAETFAEQYELDICFIVPAAVSPFKNKTNASDDARLDMLRLAFAGNARFVVDDREIRRGGTSYTIDTLYEYYAEFLDDKIYLLLGSDAAAGFTNWRQWTKILSLARVCMALRPLVKSDGLSIGSDEVFYSDEQEEGSPVYVAIAKFSSMLSSLGVPDSNLPLPVAAPLIEISSTDIRQRIADARSIRYLVPESVRNYILDNRLYKK